MDYHWLCGRVIISVEIVGRVERIDFVLMTKQTFLWHAANIRHLQRSSSRDECDQEVPMKAMIKNPGAPQIAIPGIDGASSLKRLGRGTGDQSAESLGDQTPPQRI